MGWDKDGRYYTRSKRVNGRVAREYVGGGGGAARGEKDASIRLADFYQRRMDAANKRFLAAVKALAVVRKLAVPVLQVNIAKKQVNVAAPVAVGLTPD